LKKGQRRGRGQPVRKKVKTFLATYRPAYGTIRVVIVQEPTGCQFFCSLDPTVWVEEILELFADRAAIEQDFHDLKEVWGAGQQQVRHLGANRGAWHLNLWMHTLVELWAWNQSKKRICDRRDSPWDDPAAVLPTPTAARRCAAGGSARNTRRLPAAGFSAACG
jgi:hypothetical protein